MQSALTFASPVVMPLAPSKSVSQVTTFPTKLASSLSSPHKVAAKVATVNYDTSTVDYSSMFSVFPAEACETVGGDACLAEMYPEARVQAEARNDKPQVASESVDREYLEYNDPKTVFLGEACDELGGMFCEHEYQKGVY